MNKVALAFMAHPDDAELLCAGTLIRLADDGWTVHIATATAGDCGTMTLGPARISAVRTKEARAAASLIGASYRCLREKDGFVVHDKPTMRKVIDLLRAAAPSLVFAHAPRDYMVDHEVASLLARSAGFLHAAPNVSKLPRRPGSAVPHLYYCDPLEGIDPLGALVRPTTVVDISGVIGRKTAMLACHKSQRSWLMAHHGVDGHLEAMKRHAAARGKLIGRPFAEAFVQHRGHAHPRDDLLAACLGGGGYSSGAVTRRKAV